MKNIFVFIFLFTSFVFVKNLISQNSNMINPYLVQADSIIEVVDNGQINWTKQEILATGFCVLDTVKFKNKRQAKALAERCATIVAKANLLEIVKGIYIVRKTTVDDFMMRNDRIRGEVEGRIKNTRQVGKAKEIDGVIEVTVAMSIYKANGLAPILKDEIRPTPQVLEAVEVVETEEISQEENQKPEAIAFNFQNGDFNPSVFPVVIDEKTGKTILDFSKYYNHETGEFPKFIKLSKKVMEEANFTKAVNVIDAIQKEDGSIVIDLEKNEKAKKWIKVLNSAKRFFPIILSLI